MPFADHKFVFAIISLVLIISLCQRSNHIAADGSASPPPWREVEMCNHDEDGKTLSLYHDAKLHGTSTLMHVADLTAGSCEWVRVLDSGTYFTGTRDPKTGRIALHNIVRLPPIDIQSTVEEKHEETSTPDEVEKEEVIKQKLSVGSVSKDKKTTPASAKPATKQQKSTADSTSLLKILTPEEAQQRNRIRTKVWNTNSVNVHLMILNGVDDGVSDLHAEHFGVIPANEEAYFVFPMNRTILATREDDPQVVITQFHHNGSKRLVIVSDNKSTSNKKKMIQQRVKFQQDYLDSHGYAWCGPIVDHLKPRGAPWLPMWSAEYLGQRHQVSSTNLQLKACSLDEEETINSKSKKTKKDKKLSKNNDATTKIAGLCPSQPSSSKTSTSSSMDDGNTGKLSLELEVISTSPKIFLIRNFLSSEEADLIVSTATPHLRQSEIGSTSAGAKTHRQDDIRKSSTAWLPWSFSPNFLKHIYYRAADLLQIPREYFDSNAIVEDLQVVRYFEEEKYQGHYDWGDFGHNHTRFITLLMYLNDPEEGGETAFLNAPHPTDKEQVGFKIHPGKGSAILFYNLLEDGNGDVSTFHASLPVLKGVKWLSNLWVWDPFFQEMQYKMLKLLIEQQTQQRINGKAKSISGIEETLDFGNEYDDEL